MDIRRRQFLRADISAKHNPIRPPWSVNLDQFYLRCTRCNSCINTCPQHILIKGQGGYPEVDFKHGECTFCQDCVSACQLDALSNENDKPWNFSISISNNCLNSTNSYCISCADQCEPEAIILKPGLAGNVTASIDQSLCTACGACIASCPVDAIKIHTSYKQ